jgi:hypothetical protein
MGLLHVYASSPYLNTVCQLFMLSAALVKITDAHCYTTSISVPEMVKPKHINLALNIEAEISSLEHSILNNKRNSDETPCCPNFFGTSLLVRF